MTLANIFYILGISYFVLSAVIMIALLIGGWIAFHKLKEYQQHLEAKIKHDFNLKNVSRVGLQNAAPLLTSGLMGWGLRQLKKKIFDR